MLRFWAIIPGDPVQAEVMAFKREAASVLHTSRALRSPAHITVIPPVRLGLEDAVSIDQVISTLHHGQDPFPVVCHGFDSFPTRVLYVGIPDQECLVGTYAGRIHALLNDKLPDLSLRNRPYRPHMTIAFRDLTEEAFLQGQKHFAERRYHREWMADGIWRLDHHGHRWVAAAFLPFRGVDRPNFSEEDQPAKSASL